MWGNIQERDGQVYISLGNADNFTYNDIEGGWEGEGNIDQNPLTAPGNYYLSDSSPCIDAGDASTTFNDPEDQGNPGLALWPSLGGLRNDMGAYGGPGRSILADTPTLIDDNPESKLPRNFVLGQNLPNPFNPATTIRLGR